MIEVLWHGRGGQGAFTAARLLGAAASLDDKRYALAFPSFGPERRGAPMRAFTKIDTVQIGDRSAVSKADFVIYLDGTLLAPGWERELKPGGICLVNTADALDDPRLLAIDADGLATELLGRPIPNTVFLGALAQLADCVDRESVEEAIRQYMPAKLHKGNIKVVEHAIALVQQADVVGHAEATAGESAGQPGAATETVTGLHRSAHSSAAHMPQLFATAPEPSAYAETTCYTAGYLTQVNAGWRNVRPVLDADACTGCLQCYLYCPDGAIFKVAGQNKAGVSVDIDLDFCKGCGVCAAACKFDALSMAPEANAKEA